MAKQSVSVLERHVEKIACGVAGAVLLAMIALFVAGSPNSSEMAGATVGPNEVGAKMKELADGLYGAIKAKTPEPLPVTAFGPLVQKKNPFAMDAELARRYAIAPAPINVRPPDLVGPQIGKVKLAKILPPSKPVVFQGRNRATLPPSAPLSGSMEPMPANPDGTGTQPTDATWVTVAAAVPRAQQREVFTEASYSPRRFGLYITQVRLQRQMLKPDGTWTDPENVQSFTFFRPPQIPRVTLAQDADGWAIDAVSGDQMQRLWADISRPEVQTGMWRPPLAPYLEAKTWTPPPLDGVNWRDWLGPNAPGSAFGGGQVQLGAGGGGGGGVGREPAPGRGLEEIEPAPRAPLVAPRSTPGAGRGAGGPLERPGAERRAAPAPRSGRDTSAAAEQRAAIEKARTDLEAARKLRDSGQLADALQLVLSVLSTPNLPGRMKADAEDLRVKLENAMSDEQKRAVAAEQRRREQEELGMAAETDVEPLWAHDLNARPGRTYRYRLQFDVYNRYVGQTTELENVEDAKLAVLTSEWSEWSEPVTVRPDVYVFFTRANPADRTATLEVHKWSGGSWVAFTPKVEVGERIVINDKRTGLVDTQWTVIDIQAAVKRPFKRPGRSGSFQIEERTVDVLVVADADGVLQERIREEDMKSPDRDQIREENREARESKRVGG